MFGIAIIVFRETLEAALFVGIIAAATRGLVDRSRHLAAGVLAGVTGALALAWGAEGISTLADGVGQDLLNAAMLSLALTMLVWHCVWVSNQGQKAAIDARMLGASFGRGQQRPWALMVVVALSVLREGAEAVLFVAGYARGSDPAATVAGALAGAAGGDRHRPADLPGSVPRSDEAHVCADQRLDLAACGLAGKPIGALSVPGRAHQCRGAIAMGHVQLAARGFGSGHAGARAGRL